MRYKHTLVLQFPAGGLQEFDKLIEVEDLLSKYLHGLAEVDGHDAGIEEMNIFIFTDKPREAFEKAKFIVQGVEWLPLLSAAYRLGCKDEYFRLWPLDSTQPFTVARHLCKVLICM